MSKSSKPSQTEIAMTIKEFGHWKVIKNDEERYRYVLCECECGKVKSVRADTLIKGDSTSCGCYSGIPCGKKFKSKSRSSHPLYNVYHSMHDRCYNENKKDYKWYGGKGITVCDRWGRKNTEGFNNFLMDMEESYERGLELERLDVNKNYCPTNCTWITRQSQLNNLTRSRKVSGWFIELTVTEWGYFLQFNGKMLDDRINKLCWEGKLEDILEDTFRDRQHKMLYKGKICNAGEIWSAEGFTRGQRNWRLNKYGLGCLSVFVMWFLLLLGVLLN